MAVYIIIKLYMAAVYEYNYYYHYIKLARIGAPKEGGAGNVDAAAV